MASRHSFGLSQGRWDSPASRIHLEIRKAAFCGMLTNGECPELQRI